MAEISKDELLDLCRKAYLIGRRHQLDNGYPDAGMGMPKVFETSGIVEAVDDLVSRDY